MLNRRQFLSEATVTLLLVPIAACSSSSTDPPSTPAVACDGISATSTTSVSHTHQVCVPAADLASPPAAGATYTSTGPDPNHTITLTSAQLTSIKGGQAVTVTTSTANAHTHQFTLKKA